MRVIAAFFPLASACGPADKNRCSLRSVSVLLIVLLASAPAAAGNDIALIVESQKFRDGQVPTLILKVNKSVASGTLKLKGGGETVQKRFGNKARGGAFRIRLPHRPLGLVTWKGSLAFSFQDGSTGQMPLTFQTEQTRLFKFKVTNDEEDIRVKQRVLVKAPVRVAKINVEVYGEYDKMLANEFKAFKLPAAETELEVKWLSKYEGDPLYLKVVVYDEHGNFRDLTLFPYPPIEIRHEDIVFESGKHEVRQSESPKLEPAVPEIEEAVRRYGKALNLDGRELVLMIIGHTDTVGPASSNRALSQRRAYAIAGWLKRAGVKIPIYCAGSGEDDLKVQTPDETEEAANRRVEYLVTVVPEGGVSGFKRVR